jgi:hypothetical protein
MKLSILICSLESRRHFLNNLLNVLNSQKTDEVEILTEIDNGQMQIGRKRNILVGRAQGHFLSFIDDDDSVAHDYVSKILNATRTDPDAIGIEGIMTTNGHNPRKFIHSRQYDSWFERDGIYYRNNNHLNPIKASIVRQVPFLEINHGEDSDFSRRVKPLIHTEVYVHGPIYYYQFVNK